MDNARLFARVRKLRLLSTKLVDSLLSGNYRSLFRGPGIEFDEVREYTQGDDARLIDWNVSSRMASPYTKLFREERELTLFILVDMSASLLSGSGAFNRLQTESMLFALLSFAAVRNNDRVGALFFTDRIEHWVPPMKGRRHVLRMIQDLLVFRPEGRGSDLSLALRASGEALKRRGICVILSDFKTSGYMKDLTLMAKRHDVIAVNVSDPTDHEYPRSGLVELEDPETGDTLFGLGGSRRFRREYRLFWKQQRRRWEIECRKRGIGTLSISSDEDPALKLVKFFQRRKGA